MTLLQIMKLLHHSQGYSQYTFIHKYRVSHTTSQWSGPAELACHVVYNWPRGNMVTPACINRQPQQDGGATQRGMEGRGVQCYECLSKHRLNLIDPQSVFVYQRPVPVGATTSTAEGAMLLCLIQLWSHFLCSRQTLASHRALFVAAFKPSAGPVGTYWHTIT